MTVGVEHLTLIVFWIERSGQRKRKETLLQVLRSTQLVFNFGLIIVRIQR